MRIVGLALLASVAVLVCGSGQASATTLCTGEYNAANGTISLPGTSIGQVQAGCEIGPFSPTSGSNGNAATVNPVGANPSIYQFSWAGGNLTIAEELGNNGYGYNIDVELGLEGTVKLNTDGSLSSALASISIPYKSGPGAPVDVITDMYLAAGTYALDTYLGTCALDSCSGSGSSTDPQYQVQFTPVSATPLPATVPLFASGLALAGMLGWRRKRKIDAATA